MKQKAAVINPWFCVLCVRSMNTTHQYLLYSAPPEKEAKFRELKRRHGSVFAFHGSSVENWHCVLRLG